MARLKRKQSGKKIRLPKRRLIYDDKADYGEACQKPDMLKDEYEMAKNNFLQIFKNRYTHDIARPIHFICCFAL